MTTTTTETPTIKQPLLAFHGDPAIKAKYLARVRAHARADEIIHGQYWENGRGCAVGCTIHSGNHDAYESELGIPVYIAYLEDVIFEGLSNGESQLFPAKFLQAIKPGADLRLVIPKLVVWSGMDEKEGIINLAGSDKEQEIVRLVAGLHQRIIDGGTVTQVEWEDAYSRAWAGAWAWARAWARAGAWAGAWAWARAWARAWAWARARAGQKQQWERLAEKFLELLEEAPIPKLHG